MGQPPGDADDQPAAAPPGDGFFARPPQALGFWSPACLMATWFGAGLLPGAPGTWGSLAALPFAWVIQAWGGAAALAAAAGLAFLVGMWAAGRYGRAAGSHDPGAVVIDEVAGQWLVLVAAGTDWRLYVAGFLLFRLADIVKPWPAGWLDRRVGGGFGVMIDDIAAALWALIPLAVFLLVQPAAAQGQPRVDLAAGGGVVAAADLDGGGRVVMVRR